MSEKYTNKAFDRVYPALAEPNILVLIEKVRQRHRDIVMELMNTLEESSWIEAPGFWRDAGLGVEQWVSL